MTLERLLLSGSGRIGRGAFWGGLVALVVYAAAVAVIFRIPEGAFCAMDPRHHMGQVYFAALAVLAVLGAVMLVAIGAKRLSDMGWPDWLACLPALAGLAALVAMKLEGLGACGALTEPRLAIGAAGLGLLGLLILVGGFWPGRRNRPDDRQGPGPQDSPGTPGQ